MFVFGIVMAVLGASLPGLFERIGFGKGQAADLFLVMNFAMLLMSLVFGPVVDRFGFKAFLSLASLVVGLSLFAMAGAATYPLLVAAVLALGLGGGGLNGGANALTSDLNPDRRAAALNLLGIFFGFGALTVPFLIGTLVERFGLSAILYFTCLLCGVPLALFGLARFPRPKQRQGFPLREAGSIIRSPVLWLAAFLLFFQSANEFTVGGWLATYLREQFAMSGSAASLTLAGYWAAVMAGRLLAALVINRTGRMRLVLGSAGLALAAALLLVAAPSSAGAAAGAVLIGLGFSAIYPTTLAVVGGSFPAISGTAFSVVFTVALCGGMTAPWLAGKVAQTAGLRTSFMIPVACLVMIITLAFWLKKRSEARVARG
jgi:fucose permease